MLSYDTLCSYCFSYEGHHICGIFGVNSLLKNTLSCNLILNKNLYKAFQLMEKSIVKTSNYRNYRDFFLVKL